MNCQQKSGQCFFVNFNNCLLFDLYCVNPNAVNPTCINSVFIVPLVFTFCDYFVKKCITSRNLEQVESFTQMPCPQVFFCCCLIFFFYSEETQPDTAYYFSVWWKMKCHRLLFRAQSPIYLHPVYFGQSVGLLMSAEVLFCSSKTFCVLQTVCNKEVDSTFLPLPQWRESENLVQLVFEACRVCRPGNLISLVNISGSWWYIVLWILSICYLFFHYYHLYPWKAPYWLGYFLDHRWQWGRMSALIM